MHHEGGVGVVSATSGVAFVFPGQGSQRVGMGADLAERHPDIRKRYFDAADEILGFGLTQLCLEGPEDDLRRTDITQPAIFTVSLATLEVLRHEGIEPDAAAGHSLGEYAALACAGVLDFADGLQLVRRRGELMAAVNERTPGAMAAVLALDPTTVERLCAEVAEAGGLVEPANYNDPTQTVISGEVAAVGRATDLAQGAGGRVIPLAVGAPFHCSLMDGLAEEFAAALDRCTFHDPTMPVVANATGRPVADAGEVREQLRRQVAGPVRWTDTLQHLRGLGCETFVEVGPGRALSAMVMRTLPGATTHATDPLPRLDKAVAALRATA